jgi:hypothetical protein
MWALILMSIGPICLYAVIWLGWIKSWYILVPLPGKFNSSAIYALLPIGLAFSMLLIAAAFFPVEARTSLDIWSVLFLLFGGVGLLFIVWCPSWLKPPWVRWLEREYRYGLQILLEEARVMGRWQWEARVRTRQGLEDWAQEVLEKRQEDMYWAWEDWVDWQVIRRMGREGKKKLATIEQYMIPYVPEHRKEDYEHYLKTSQEKIKVNKELGYL